MPYIIGQVNHLDDTGSSPCMDFQVECVNKPVSNITHAPPYFWVTVPQDEYILEVTTSTGESATAVAKVLTTFGGVRLNVSVT